MSTQSLPQQALDEQTGKLSNPQPARTHALAWNIGALLLLGAATFLVFGRSRAFGYLPWDDLELIARNPHLGPDRLYGLWQIWSTAYDALYMPVTYTSWWIEKLMGAGAATSHTINVILHALTSWGVFLCARCLLGNSLQSGGAALSAALLFCLHPVQVETVAWASSRKDLLAGLFGIFSVWAFIHARTLHSRPYYFAALLLFAAAILSKASIAALPLTLLLLDITLNRQPARRSFLSILPFHLVTIVASIIAYMAQRSASATSSTLSDISVAIPHRVLVAGDSYAMYTKRLLWPVNLSPVYDRTVEQAVSGSAAVIALVGLAFLISVPIYKRANGLSLLVGAVLLLLPVSGIVPFHYQAIALTADRYLYLPTALLAVAVAAVTSAVLVRSKALGSVAVVVILVIALLCCRLAHQQVSIWRDSLSLWGHAVAAAPNSAVVHANYAMSLTEAGRAEEALPHLEDAVRQKPDYSIAHYNLGVAREQRGEMDAAITHYQLAVKSNPRLAPAQSTLAAYYFQKQQPEQAEAAARAALQVTPDDFTSIAVLASILGNQGKVDQAITLLRDAAKRNPTNQKMQEILTQAQAIAGK